MPETKAQVQVNINIGQQPAWGPTGYDYAAYYYFPDYNFYFDVNSGRYVILSGNNWTFVNQVPGSFHFDPYNAYKVVLKENKPWLQNQAHNRDYARYKGMGARQGMIRDSREEKYFESRQHPQHAAWTKKHPEQNKTANQTRPANNNNKTAISKGSRQNNTGKQQTGNMQTRDNSGRR